MQTLNIRYIIPVLLCLPLWACSNLTSWNSSATALSADTPNAQVTFADAKELYGTSPDESYLIESGDTLDIKVLKAPEFSGKEKVHPDGMITITMLGDIQAEGLTTAQLKQRIVEQLRQKYLQNPQVTVSAESQGQQFITVDGAVRSKGIHAMKDSRINLMQAIALAGGLDNVAAPDKVLLFRQNGEQTKAYRLDVNTMTNGQIKAPYVKDGDMIFVHNSESRYLLHQVANSVGSLNTILTSLLTYSRL